MNIEVLQKQLNTKVELEIIQQALMHSSYINSEGISINNLYSFNKVKATIGRFVIDLVSKLYYIFETEKAVSDVTRSINVEAIATHFYDKYKFNKYVYISKSEEKTGTIKYIEQVYIIIYELYLVEGYKFVYNLFRESISSTEMKDYKTLLQEYVQSFKQSVKYETIERINVPTPSFTVKLTALGRTAKATATSKKEAEKKAAKNYIITNNIKFNDKKRKTLVEYIERKSLDSRRKIQLKELINELRIPENYIDYNIIDLALTHASWSKKNKLEDYSQELSLIGSELFVLEFNRANLLYHLDLDTVKASEYNRARSKMLNEDNCFNKVSKIYGESLSKCYKLLDLNMSSKIYLTNAYKNILGALIYKNFISSKENTIKFQNFCLDFIDKLSLNDCDNNDYNSWIIDFTQEMDAEIIYNNLKEIGKSNNRVYSATATLVLNKYNIKNITVSVAEKTKAKLRTSIAKKIFYALKSEIDITYNISSINNNVNKYIDDILTYSLKPTAFLKMKLEMIGGLFLDDWNRNLAIILLKEFRRRGLNNQIDKLQNMWSTVHGNKYEMISELDVDNFEVKNISRNKQNIERDESIQNKEISSNLLDILNNMVL